MAHSFTPLLPRQPTEAAPETPGKNQTAPGPSFTPALFPATPPSPGQATPDGIATAQPKITLKKDGDRVTQILIECSCHQIIQLDCLSADAAPGQEPPPPAA